MTRQFQLDDVALAIKAMDLSDENEAIGELEAEGTQIDLAIQRANSRIQEIAETIRARTTQGEPIVDGAAVANALLADIAPSEAAAEGGSLSELEQERDALRMALRDLGTRKAAVFPAIQALKGAAFARLGPAVRPLVEMLAEEARIAGRQIIECYAALTAIRHATRHGYSEMMAAEAAVQGLVVDRGLFARSKELTVPDDILQALQPIAEKGAATPSAILRVVPAPH